MRLKWPSPKIADDQLTDDQLNIVQGQCHSTPQSPSANTIIGSCSITISIIDHAHKCHKILFK